MSQLQFQAYEPGSSRYAPRRTDEEWERHHDLLKILHSAGVSRRVMRQRLEERGFRVTAGQLTRKMIEWSLIARCPLETNQNRQTAYAQSISTFNKGTTSPIIHASTNEASSYGVIAANAYTNLFSSVPNAVGSCARAETDSGCHGWPIEELVAYNTFGRENAASMVDQEFIATVTKAKLHSGVLREAHHPISQSIQHFPTNKTDASQPVRSAAHQPSDTSKALWDAARQDIELRLRVVEDKLVHPMCGCRCQDILSGRGVPVIPSMDIYRIILRNAGRPDNVLAAIATVRIIERQQPQDSLPAAETKVLNDVTRYLSGEVAEEYVYNEAASLFDRQITNSRRAKRSDIDIASHLADLQLQDDFASSYALFANFDDLLTYPAVAQNRTTAVQSIECQELYKSILNTEAQSKDGDCLLNSLEECRNVLVESHETISSYVPASDDYQEKYQPRLDEADFDVIDLAGRIAQLLVTNISAAAGRRDLILYHAVGLMLAQEIQRSVVEHFGQGIFSAIEVKMKPWILRAITHCLDASGVGRLTLACWVCEAAQPPLLNCQFLHFGPCEAEQIWRFAQCSISDFDAPRRRSLMASLFRRGSLGSTSDTLAKGQADRSSVFTSSTDSSYRRFRGLAYRLKDNISRVSIASKVSSDKMSVDSWRLERILDVEEMAEEDTVAIAERRLHDEQAAGEIARASSQG